MTAKHSRFSLYREGVATFLTGMFSANDVNQAMGRSTIIEPLGARETQKAVRLGVFGMSNHRGTRSKPANQGGDHGGNSHCAMATCPA